jgi:hypothetical protein
MEKVMPDEIAVVTYKERMAKLFYSYGDVSLKIGGGIFSPDVTRDQMANYLQLRRELELELDKLLVYVKDVNF